MPGIFTLEKRLGAATITPSTLQRIELLLRAHTDNCGDCAKSPASDALSILIKTRDGRYEYSASAEVGSKYLPQGTKYVRLRYKREPSDCFVLVDFDADELINVEVRFSGENARESVETLYAQIDKSLQSESRTHRFFHPAWPWVRPVVFLIGFVTALGTVEAAFAEPTGRTVLGAAGSASLLAYAGLGFLFPRFMFKTKGMEAMGRIARTSAMAVGTLILSIVGSALWSFVSK